jgi:hypothetical protein
MSSVRRSLFFSITTRYLQIASTRGEGEFGHTSER